MSASKTAEAAAKAVARSKQTEAKVRTDLEVIADIRKNFAAGLAVTPDDQKFLLQMYDDVHMLMVQGTNLLKTATATIELLDAEIGDLKKRNEEFRDVYQRENSSLVIDINNATEKIFTEPPAGVPDSTEAGSVESVPEQVA